MRPEQRLSMIEQATAVGRTRAITCPECRADQFAAISTWWRMKKEGGEIRRRRRKCRNCGYSDNEDVLPPIRDRDKPIDGIETTERETHENNS